MPRPTSDWTATTCSSSSRPTGTRPTRSSTQLRLTFSDQHELKAAGDDFVGMNAACATPGAARVAQQVRPDGQRLIVKLGVCNLTDAVSTLGKHLETDDGLNRKLALI